MQMLLIFFVLLFTACEHAPKSQSSLPEKKKMPQARHVAQKSSSQKQQLKDGMDFRLGAYAPVSEVYESCYDGRLELIEDEHGDLSFVIGGRPLITQVHPEGRALRFKEEDCNIEIQTRLKQGVLERRERRLCADGLFTFRARLSFDGDLLSYSLQSLKDGESVRLLRCQLERQQP